MLSSNQLYRNNFGEIAAGDRCYRVSHGYNRPCDQAGESCPLTDCKSSREKERVLHIHNTPRGREHIDVEMLPLKDQQGELRYFIEVLKPVHIASAEIHSELMVGQCPAFNNILEMINLVAPRDTSVLLLGESGTGKELAATAIHNASQRADKNIVTVECAGLTDTLFESELFGHVKGAFTGATSNKPGLLADAHGGSLFLDEIGDIPLGMQVKLLRLLEKLAGDDKHHLTDSAIKSLQQQTFQGNIRELRNILERSIIFAHSNVIDAQVLERCLEPSTQLQASPKHTWQDLKTQEKIYLSALLDHCQGDKERAAAIAGISIRSLYRKLAGHDV